MDTLESPDHGASTFHHPEVNRPTATLLEKAQNGPRPMYPLGTGRRPVDGGRPPHKPRLGGYGPPEPVAPGA